MRTKKEIYKNEQIQLSNKIIDILELDDSNQITLFILDNDPVKIKKIMDLLPDLRKYFSYRNIVGIEIPESIKRPWLSIIRHITKLTHIMHAKTKQIYVNKLPKKTRIYTFIPK